MKLEQNGKYVTQEGQVVRVLATDMPVPFPVIAWRTNQNHGTNSILYYRVDGTSALDRDTIVGKYVEPVSVAENRAATEKPPTSRRRAVIQALREAGIDPSTVRYACKSGWQPQIGADLWLATLHTPVWSTGSNDWVINRKFNCAYPVNAPTSVTYISHPSSALPSWRDLVRERMPSGCGFAAMDRDGMWFAYTHKPVPSVPKGMWVPDACNVAVALKQGHPTDGCSRIHLMPKMPELAGVPDWNATLVEA